MPYVKVVVDVLIPQELLDLKVTVADDSVHHPSPYGNSLPPHYSGSSIKTYKNEMKQMKLKNPK